MSSTTCLVSWPSAPLTDRLVRRSLEHLPAQIVVVTSLPDTPTDFKLIQWSSYDHIDHELTHLQREKVLSSSYTFRKALIRKHYLSRCIHSYVTKHPTSSLKTATPRTFEIDISFADELDEMWADDLWDLGEALDASQSWWILKPGMSDRGMGIRLFNSKETLQRIFEDFDEDDSEDGDSDNYDNADSAVVTSQLRHFVIQEYISKPLLLDLSSVTPKPRQSQGCKFHLRTYCVASGALRVYMYDRILALFSSVPYKEPATTTTVDSDDQLAFDLAPHLTNTSLQAHKGEEGVYLLDELVGCPIFPFSSENAMFTETDKGCIVSQMVDILSETFKAGLENPVHFQPLPNAFELYGIDFLIEMPGSRGDIPSYQVKLLEINAEPAIELTGPRLTWILEDLFVSIGMVCVEPFLAREQRPEDGSWDLTETRHHFIKCLDDEVRGSR